MNIPSEMREKPNWILWRNEDGRKVPYQIDGRHAKSNDRTTWVNFIEVEELVNDTFGLGFVFDGSGIVGIDLDACLIDGEIQPWAQEIIERIQAPVEISPSGSGVHLYGRGEVGKGRKAAVKADGPPGKSPGIEMYDRGRYFAFTGDWLVPPGDNLPDITDGLAWLQDRFWPKPVSSSAPPLASNHNVIERARRYLQEVPPAISGSGGHNQTFFAACKLVIGFGLSPDDAYPLLAEWNERCEPPWTEKELRHKLDSADKQEGERGELLRERPGFVDSDVDLGPLISSLTATTEQEKPKQEPDITLPPEVFDGMPRLMRLAFDWTLATAIKPQPELTIAAMIALFGAILGRKVRDDYDTRTNVMILGLSPSGSGKEHPRQCCKRILYEADLAKINAPERIGSHAGLISVVSTHPVRLFLLDEIGRLLLTMRDPKASHLYNIGTVLMQMYSSANTTWIGDAYADQSKTKTIDQPAVSVFGTSVPGSFYRGLSIDNISDGLLGRMLLIESQGYVSRQKPRRLDVPEELLDGIRSFEWGGEWEPAGNLEKQHPRPRLVPKTAEANERHEIYCREVDARHRTDSEDEATLWARTPEKEAKLALIYACCENPRSPEITLDAVNWGRKIANYSTRKLLHEAGRRVHVNREWGEHEDRAWERLKDGMTQRDFQRATRLRKRELNEMLETWIEAGAIEIVKLEGRGRPSREIRKLTNKCP